MDRLIRGYRDFMNRRWPQEHSRYAELAKAQSPRHLVIACSDSRVDPTVIFSADPGELFIIRNVAAIVPPYETNTGYHGTSAALAFAVVALNVTNIVVLGHAQCGGVAAALQGASAQKIPFISEWIELLDPAVARCKHHGHDAQYELEHETIKLSLERLMTFPFVAERVAAGKLQLDGARFGIADGVLEVLDRKSGRFEPVARD